MPHVQAKSEDDSGESKNGSNKQQEVKFKSEGLKDYSKEADEVVKVEFNNVTVNGAIDAKNATISEIMLGAKSPSLNQGKNLKKKNRRRTSLLGGFMPTPIQMRTLRRARRTVRRRRK